MNKVRIHLYVLGCCALLTASLPRAFAQVLPDQIWLHGTHELSEPTDFILKGVFQSIIGSIQGS